MSALALGSAIACSRDRVLAQITSDPTLGGERSVITRNMVIMGLASDRVDGGARRGPNLFHSFEQFNVDAGRGAYFTNPTGVENILSRVTGSNPSNIFGRLGVLGNANLFLINPHGIIFGPNASLNVGGSFVATTAHAVLLGDTGTFSASEPASSILLSVKPSAFFFNSLFNQAIVNRSRVGLNVPNGRSLLLVGGDVRLEGGILRALGGQVELGGLEEPGTVGLQINANNLYLNFPDGVVRSDVFLTGRARVNVTAGSGGRITVDAKNLSILEGSTLTAGIGQNLGAANSQAGDITLNATGEIQIAGSGSGIFNTLSSGGSGKGGSINVTTGSLSLRDGAQLVTSTSGYGNAGSVTITARDAVSFDGVDSNRNSSGVFSGVAGGRGEGGNIKIDVTAGSLFITNGALLSSNTSGQGNAGMISIEARDAVYFDGATSNSVSGALSAVNDKAVGNGGGINITTGSLYVSNGAQLTASTRGVGNAGNVTITAKDTVLFNGEGGGKFSSGAFSTVEAGESRGGDIDIQARSLAVTGGAELQTLTRGTGNAGNIRVTVSDAVNLSGTSSRGGSSGFISSSEAAVTGQGGDIAIRTGALRVSDGAVLSARTRSASSGGNITVDARTIEMTGGGQLLTTTFGSGQAGNITVHATDSLTISGSDPTYDARLARFTRSVVDPASAASGLFANTDTDSTGQGGSINLTTGKLNLQDGAQVAVNSQGTGIAGNIEATANSTTLDNRAKLTAETFSVNGGNITLQVPDLLLIRHGSQISTSAGTANAGGNGGNIRIDTKFIVAVPNENSDIRANAFKGNGGNVRIAAQGIFGTQFRPQDTPLSDITASSQYGLNGVVQIVTPGIDPSRGLTDLPVQTVDASRQIAPSCGSGAAVASQQNKFVITGRGGLPPSPKETLDSEAVVTNWVTLDRQVGAQDNGQLELSSLLNGQDNATPTHSPSLVEAQGWMYGPNGEVILTANPTTVTLHSPSQHSTECRVQ